MPYSYNVGINSLMTINVRANILSEILECSPDDVDRLFDELIHDSCEYTIVFTTKIVDWSIKQEVSRCKFLDSLDISDIGEYADKPEITEKWQHNRFINKLAKDRALRKATAFT